MTDVLWAAARVENKIINIYNIYNRENRILMRWLCFEYYETIKYGNKLLITHGS